MWSLYVDVNPLNDRYYPVPFFHCLQNKRSFIGRVIIYERAYRFVEFDLAISEIS